MITVTGSLAFDHIMDFPGNFSDHIMPDKIHQINLSFLVNTLSKQRGGTAGNIAYNLALLKTPVRIVGAAGEDFGDYADFLLKAGVDISCIQKIDNSLTSSAFIMTDLSDNQITAFYPGAMEHADKLSLQMIKSDFVVVSPNNPKAMVKFAAECQSSEIPYMLDPGMQLPSINTADLISMVKGANILIGNDYEISLFREKLSLTEPQLLNQVGLLITTLGEKGSCLQTKEETINITPGKVKEVVDPTGAGDAYRAGFLAGKQKGFDLKACGQMGAVTACYAIEKYGTSNHIFSVDEFEKRYEENFGEALKLP